MGGFWGSRNEKFREVLWKCYKTPKFSQVWGKSLKFSGNISPEFYNTGVFPQTSWKTANFLSDMWKISNFIQNRGIGTYCHLILSVLGNFRAFPQYPITLSSFPQILGKFLRTWGSFWSFCVVYPKLFIVTSTKWINFSPKYGDWDLDTIHMKLIFAT